MSSVPPVGVVRTRRWDFAAIHELAIAGALGGIIGLYYYGEVAAGWPTLRQANGLWWARDILAGVVIGGAIGFFLNGLPAARTGTWLKLARDGITSALLGALGGAVGLVLGELVLGGMRGGPVGRAVSWSILGLAIGVSQGVAARSWQRLRFGILGGLLGGFLGGLLFEVLRERLGAVYDPARSQGLGVVILGAGLGAALALVEQALRRSWVRVLQGRQEGRSYLLPHAVNRLGLDEQAEVGLFGDPGVARQHALIRRTPAGYVFEVLDDTRTTLVNGHPAIGTLPLRDGDRITLGRTLIQFCDRLTPKGN